MAMVLVKSVADYADEFDVFGFDVMTQEQFDKYDEDAKKYFETATEDLECSFGSNEAVTFSSYTDWSNCLELISISDEEAAVFTKFFTPYRKATYFGKSFISTSSEHLSGAH